MPIWSSLAACFTSVLMMRSGAASGSNRSAGGARATRNEEDRPCGPPMVRPASQACSLAVPPEPPNADRPPRTLREPLHAPVVREVLLRRRHGDHRRDGGELEIIEL